MLKRKVYQLENYQMTLQVSERSVRRIMKNDLDLRVYKKVIEPLIKRSNGKNWVRTNFRKEDVSFQMRNFLTLMVSTNCENDRVWPVDRPHADKKGGIKQRQKEMVCLGASSKGITPLLILDEGTVDHTVYIEKVFPIALRYGNETFRRDWTFQQDGARPHSHHLTQEWCR